MQPFGKDKNTKKESCGKLWLSLRRWCYWPFSWPFTKVRFIKSRDHSSLKQLCRSIMTPCLQRTTHFLLSTRFVNLNLSCFFFHTSRTVSEGHVGVYWFVRMRMHTFACAWDNFYVMCVYVFPSEWYCQARRCSTYPHLVSIAPFCCSIVAIIILSYTKLFSWYACVHVSTNFQRLCTSAFFSNVLVSCLLICALDFNHMQGARFPVKNAVRNNNARSPSYGLCVTRKLAYTFDPHITCNCTCDPP